MREVSGPFRVPNRIAAVVSGLTIAWGGTVLLIISPAVRGLGDPTHLSTALIGQSLFWLLAATVVVIVLFWEKQTLASLWLQPFRWQSIAWGLLFAVVHYAVLFPIGEWVRRTTGVRREVGPSLLMRRCRERFFRGFAVLHGHLLHEAWEAFAVAQRGSVRTECLEMLPNDLVQKGGCRIARFVDVRRQRHAPSPGAPRANDSTESNRP